MNWKKKKTFRKDISKMWIVNSMLDFVSSLKDCLVIVKEVQLKTQQSWELLLCLYPVCDIIRFNLLAIYRSFHLSLVFSHGFCS